MKNKIDKDLLRTEYEKVWDRKDMVDYCVNKVAAVAMLPGGEILPIEKRAIETRFCFGESGYDFRDAVKAADNARRSEAYFKKENMAAFREWMDDLDAVISGDSRYRLVIDAQAYYGQAADCRICNVKLVSLTDIINALGGSAYLSELPGKEIMLWGRKVRIATMAELVAIRDACAAAAAAHEKKVDSYLKRYGMSKVRAWTYWADA